MKKILVIHTAYIGDVILLTPMLKAIKKIYPDSYLAALVVPSTSIILQNNPNVDEIIEFDKRKNKFLSFIKTTKQIRDINFDLAFLPHSSMTSTLIALLGNIPRRIGFDRWTSRFLLTEKIPFQNDILRIKKNLDLLKPFSQNKFDIQTEIHTTNPTKDKIEWLIEDFPNKPLIAIAPGSIWFTKRWKEEYYKDLAEKLNSSSFFLCLIGSPEEKNICENVSPQDNYYIGAGDLNIPESAELIRHCEVMICNDCGALHIANAVKTDVFAFFGPTIQDIGYPPFRKNDKVFEVDLPCRPCGSHGSTKCPRDHHKCMKLIKPDYVFDQILQHLK